jgi:hypothetical protein
MDDSKTRLKKGMARIQFFAVDGEIEKLFAAGYSIKLAYDHLVQSGRITMSYRAFYDNLNAKKKHAVAQLPHWQQSQEEKRRKLGIGNKEPIIKHDKNPNPDEIC